VSRDCERRGGALAGGQERMVVAAAPDDHAGDEEDEGTEGDEDDAADVSYLAALENGAAMEQLDDDDVEGDYGAAKRSDVILEERVGLEERWVLVHHVEQRLLHLLGYLGRGALDRADVTCDSNQ
jgi:hypothetical protein